MSIYDLLKQLDRWFHLEAYSYNFVILVLGVLCTVVIFILFRFCVKTENKCTLGNPGKVRTRDVACIFIISSMPSFFFFIISFYSKNMELQYLAIVYGLIIALIMPKSFFNRFSIIFFALVVIFLANVSTAVNLGVEVGEQTPDTAMIMRYGRWERSLKANYYDIANVHSVLKAVLNIIMGIDAAESLLTYLILTAVNLIVIVFIICFMLVDIYKAKLWLLLPTLVILGSHPGLGLLLSPPSISLSLSLLTILLILKPLKEEKLSRRSIFVSFLSFFVSTLAHGTVVVVIAFLIITLILSRISFRNLLKYRTPLLHLLFLFMVIFGLRNTLPQILQGGPFVNYLMDLNRFLTGAISEWRSVKWSTTEVPRVTAYAWVLIVPLAIVPIISAGIDKIISKNKHDSPLDYWYSILAITGLMFICFGFIASLFSNSLGRIFYFPGVMLLGFSTPYTLNFLSRKRWVWITVLLLISLAVLPGIATPSKMPLYEPYKELTVAWRGSDFIHCLYAKDFVPFISNATTLKIYVKSDDTIPIKYFYLLLHGSPLLTRIINQMHEKTLYNIVFMADPENYICVSIP